MSRIEAAARRLFAEKGFAATTTREIAQAAEIGVGTLFVYFPEKLDLLVHLYRQDLDRVVAEAVAALPPDLPLVDACLRIFDAIYRLYEGDPALARVFVKEMLFLEPGRAVAMMDLTVRTLGRLGELFAAAQERGEVRRDVAPPFAAYQLFGLYYWGLCTWLNGLFHSRAAATDLLRASLDLMVRGMSRPGGDDGSAR